MRRVLVDTFGCKLNQYDSQVISESFASNGYELTSDILAADVCVVNTCSVTARSDYEARQLIRKMHRANPGALILVTGCYAQRAPNEIGLVKGVRFVTGNAEKSSLPRFVESLCACAETGTELSSSLAVLGQDAARDRASCVSASQLRSRALVKIQDGCNASCSYCVVPSVRGRSRSEPLETIQERVKTLESSGFREAILTGARIGSYGLDLGEGHSLEGLLRALLSITDGLRFRLSSLEPGEIGASLIDYVVREKRVCRHFHLPLQSGDPEILVSMGRPYSPNEYAERIQTIHSRLPDTCFGSDVIVGFPGESERAFRNTYALIEKLPLSYLHVFPFSRRPGTRAWHMKQEPSRAVKKTRGRALRELGMRKKSAFIESQIGTFAEVVLEEEVEAGLFKGTTGNYLKVLVRTDGKRVRDSIPVRIARRTGETLVAQAC